MIPSFRGLVPVVDFVSIPKGEKGLLYIAAKSLMGPFGKLLKARSQEDYQVASWRGLKVKLKKVSDEKMAPYQVDLGETDGTQEK